MKNVTRHERYDRMENRAPIPAARPEFPLPRTECPECGAKLRIVRDGIFQWRACPKCRWDVFQ